MRKLPGTSILCGDFNFCSTWDENENIPNDFIDVWPMLREDAGWTEDTDINIMRFLMKNKKKQVRFDRVILYENSQYQPVSIDLVGTTPLENEDNIWPSDHFGLISKFTLKSPT